MPRPKKAPPSAASASHYEFEHVMSCSDENGLISSQPVRVMFDPSSLQFVANLPAHLIERPEDRASVYGERMSDLVQEFEQRNEAFSIARLRLQATTHMLLAGVYTLVSDAGKQILRIDKAAGLGMTEIAFNPATPDVFYLREGEKVLSISCVRMEPHVILPDTPEIRERLTSMIGSIDTAASVLNGLCAAQDPAAYLLALDGPWTIKADTPAAEPEPVKTDSPFASDDEI